MSRKMSGSFAICPKRGIISGWNSIPRPALGQRPPSFRNMPIDRHETIRQ